MTSGDRGTILILSGIALIALAAATVREHGWGREPVVVVPAANRPHPRIDLNSARWQDLTLLPGIGESRARSIVAFREEVGGLRHLDELDHVRGIGPSLIQRLRGRVVLRRPGAESSR